EPPPDPPPAALGFRMPAEWEPHAATWIAWPHEARDWPGKLAPIDWVYGEFVRHLAVGERVRILVHTAAVQTRARALRKPVRGGARCPQARRGEGEGGVFFPHAAGSTLAPRLLPDLRDESGGRGGRHQLAVHRLGEVREPQARRRRERTDRAARSAGAVGTDRR